MELSALSLFAATPEQAKESLRRARDQWGKDMTPQEYESRDENWIREFESARDGKFTTWILAPRDDSQTLDFKCSCKTFKWPAITIRRDEFRSQPAFCYAVGSVFTPSKHRGRGYAGHMMRLLHWVLAPESFLQKFEFPEEWGERPMERRGDGNFSILSSDIGREFYLSCGLFARPTDLNDSNGCGWVVREPISTYWDVAAAKENLGTLELECKDNFEWLNEEGVRNQCENEEMMKEDFADLAISQVTTGEDVAFAILPSQGVEAFNRRRLRHAYQDYHIDRWGLLVKDGYSSSLATWIVELPRRGMEFPDTPRKLIITRLRLGKTTDLSLILKLVIDVALTVNITTIEVWNIPQHLKEIATQLGGVEKEREAKLSAFKWYGDDHSDRVRWIFNER
ncbi:hypothetical protein V5O48_010105 [Marasmius crinis-equi]|uniref:LYC1 C-terminal domain-containing protein n=1 Tax=Marasmius crinis-equi TaxID=585013 RepID=A0ABR3F9R9_9AGAR